MLGTVQKTNAEEAGRLVRTACTLLRELLPKRVSLSASALKEIGEFLRLAEESNICADEVAALAAQFAPVDE